MSKKDSNHPIQEKNGKGKGKPIDPFLALRLHKGDPIAPHYKEHKKKKLEPKSSLRVFFFFFAFFFRAFFYSFFYIRAGGDSSSSGSSSPHYWSARIWARPEGPQLLIMLKQ